MGIRNRQRHQSRRTRIFEKRRRSRPRSTSKFNGLTDSLSIPRNHKHTNTHTETCPQTKVPFCRNARVFRISQRVFRFGKFVHLVVVCIFSLAIINGPIAERPLKIVQHLHITHCSFASRRVSKSLAISSSLMQSARNRIRLKLVEVEQFWMWMWRKW